MRNDLRLGVFCTGLTVLLTGLAAGQEGPSRPVPSLSDETSRFRDATAHLVKAREEALAYVVTCRDRLICSDAQVDGYRADLALARHDLALCERKPDAARDQLNTLIEIRERQRGRLQGSTVSQRETATADRRLASARYLLARTEGRHEDAVREMKQIAELRERESKIVSTQSGQGLVGAEEADLARYRLAYARYRFAWLEGKAEEAARQLRITVEVWERIHDRRSKLRDHGVASALEAEDARDRTQLSRIRLAVVEKKTEALQKDLRHHLVTLTGIERLTEPARLTESRRMEIAYTVAYWRWRLAAAAENLELILDDPASEFDD